jgi:hypothetical protein
LGLATGVALLMPGCVVATSGDSDGNAAGLLFLLLPFIVVVAFVALGRLGRRRRPGRRTQASRPSAAMIRAELSVLADDILRFEPRVALHEEAREDFDSATHRYRVAQAAIDEAPDEVDLARVQRVVDEAAWSMARARAIVEGRRPPQPPSRLQRPGPHGEPAIQLGEGDHPTYVGSDATYRSGWFAVGGGLFGGLLLGSMLGGFGGWVAEHGTADVEPMDGVDGDSMDW